MAPHERLEDIGALSTDQIIAAVRTTRDQQIDELKKEPVLMTFLEHYYDLLTLSDVKKQFLLRDLAELKNSPLDLSHYAALLNQMKEEKTLTVDGSHRLFLAELKAIFQKYINKG